MPLVSIIVPVYNVESFLRPCVESVLAQTMPDWELFLVDDGSTDASGAILREYEDRNPRIHGIFQENAGASAARNRGLDAAEGEYIAFLDSDDRYEPEMLETLLAAVRREQADIAACGAVTFWEDGSREPENMPLRPQVLAGRDAVMEHFLRGEQGLYCVWNRLYRREILGEIRFSPYTRGEDALFNVKVMARCKRLVNVSDCLYDYRRREGSVMSESFSPRMLDLVRSWAEIFRIMEEGFPALRSVSAAKTVWETDRLFLKGMASGHPAWPEARRELIRVHDAMYLRQFSGNIPAKKRAADALFRVSPELYYRVAGGK